jgi:hypothetical protein
MRDLGPEVLRLSGQVLTGVDIVKSNYEDVGG